MRFTVMIKKPIANKSVVILITLLLFVSCNADSSLNESYEPFAETSIMQQIDELYQKLNDDELPRQDESLYWLEMDSESIPHMPKQLVVDTPEAYTFATLIRNYLYIGGNILKDFNNQASISVPEAIKTALYHTTPIQWCWQTEEGVSGGKYLGPFDDHVISALIMRETQENRGICDVYYEKDVQNTIRKMFGNNTQFYNLSTEPYIYYDKEKIYARVGDFGGPTWVYPMLTDIKYTENGDVVCEAIFVIALDEKSPTYLKEKPDIELTYENFECETIDSKKYRYTFNKDSETNYVLKQLETLA